MYMTAYASRKWKFRDSLSDCKCLTPVFLSILGIRFIDRSDSCSLRISVLFLSVRPDCGVGNSEFEQARNDDFRKIWVDEESRVKKISAESRSRVDDVRNRMLNGLERIDAANQEMLAVMQDMILMDNEILSLASKF